MDKARLDKAQPDIFLFYDYRAYLKALFEYNKAQSRRFSHRYIVTRAGFKSPNVLKNVIDGKRNLTFAAAEQFAKAFKLEGASRKYFLALVQYNQAGTPTEREKFFQELVDMRTRENPARLGEHQYDVFSIGGIWPSAKWSACPISSFRPIGSPTRFPRPSRPARPPNPCPCSNPWASSP